MKKISLGLIVALTMILSPRLFATQDVCPGLPFQDFKTINAPTDAPVDVSIGKLPDPASYANVTFQFKNFPTPTGPVRPFYPFNPSQPAMHLNTTGHPYTR